METADRYQMWLTFRLMNWIALRVLWLRRHQIEFGDKPTQHFVYLRPRQTSRRWVPLTLPLQTNLTGAYASSLSIIQTCSINVRQCSSHHFSWRGFGIYEHFELLLMRTRQSCSISKSVHCWAGNIDGCWSNARSGRTEDGSNCWYQRGLPRTHLSAISMQKWSYLQYKRDHWWRYIFLWRYLHPHLVFS
jgi:hypothetical protein